jgi:hypothetical protein
VLAPGDPGVELAIAGERKANQVAIESGQSGAGEQVGAAGEEHERGAGEERGDPFHRTPSIERFARQDRGDQP